MYFVNIAISIIITLNKSGVNILEVTYFIEITAQGKIYIKNCNKVLNRKLQVKPLTEI